VAKKSRTPPPPRRVQSPKTRTGGLTEEQARRRLRWLIVFAASGIVALIAVAAAIALTSGGGGGSSSKTPANLAATLRAAGCTLQTFKNEGRNHIGLNQQDPSKVKPPEYNSFPPTSGNHYPVPAVFDFYDAPVLPVQEVHNLEHGAIVIHWGSEVPASEVDKLRSFYDEDTEAMLGAPLPKLGDKITLSAWTHLATCTHFDEKAFKAFRDAYRYHGPESNAIPKGSDSLKRGNV
jgi:Protein of unknown function (DUF3105)